MSNLLALPNGTELVGDYRIKRVLGAGGFGITYLAEEPSLARLVTIKEYFPADFAARTNGNNASPRSQNCMEDYQWGLDRFIDEAQTLAKFDHPNIVRVYRYFRLHQTGYMVLHFEEGASFKGWLKNLRRAPRQNELDAIIAPLLDALELIHKTDFLHRDIAPDNIIIRKDGNPVLIDFGSARGAIAQHSKTVSALVKPGYSPYEQYAMTSRNQGPWTDIYSLAATLYFAISGKRPADAPSRIIDDEFLPAREVALSSYRPEFLAAIDKALRLNVEQRPQSISEWRRELVGAQRAGADAAAGRSAYGPSPKGSPTPAAVPAAQELDPAMQGHNSPPVVDTSGDKTIAVPPQQLGVKHGPAVKRGLIELLGGVKKPSPTPGAIPATPDDLMPPQVAAAQPSRNAAPLPAKAAPAKAAPAEAASPTTIPSEAPAAMAQPSHKRRRNRKADAAQAKAPGSRLPVLARRKPPRPRRIRKKNPLGLRSLMVKLLIGVGVASAAVAMQDKLPRMETRGLGVITALHTDVALTTQLKGHMGGATGVAFSSGGKRIVSTGADATIKLWNAVSGALIRTIELDDGPASAFAVEGNRAVTGHKDGTLVLWDLELGARITSFKRNEANIWSVAFAGDPGRIVAAAHDWSVTLWDERKSGAPLHVFKGHDNAVQAVTFSSSGPFIASGGADEKVKLWDASSLTLKRTYRNLPDFVTSISIAPGGARVAVACLDGNIKLYSTKSRRTRRTLHGHDKRVTSVVYAPDAKHLASASIDGTIRLWNGKTGRTIRTFNGDAGPVHAISFSPDGKHLAAAAQDGTLRIWKTGDVMTVAKKRE